MEYMDLIPVEVETLIFKDLNYMDLKHYAQTSKARANLVYRHLAPIARRARERFGLGPRLSKQDIIERLYHVNGYTSSAFDNVTVDENGWRGPGGSINSDAILWYNSSGELHRADGPAKIWYERDARYEAWYKNGKIHRNDGPALTRYQGNWTVKAWYIEGKIHRTGDPAIIFYEGRNIMQERWYEDDKHHRIGGPATIEYYVDGKVKSETWFEKNKHYHRVDGPAIIEYDADGNVTYEEYYVDGMLKR